MASISTTSKLAASRIRKALPLIIRSRGARKRVGVIALVTCLTGMLIAGAWGQNKPQVILIATCTDDIWTPLGVPTLPFLATNNRVTLFTGDKVIVWGPSGTFAAGYVYDALNGGWTEMSGTGQPTPNAWVTGVWTGTQMLVYGGTSSSGQITGTVSSYQPRSDTWSTLNSQTLSSTASYFTSVWTGADMFVFGGSFGGEYDPDVNQWVQMNQSGEPSFDSRQPVAAAWTGSQIFVCGSFFQASTRSYVPIAGLYTPATDSWQQVNMQNAPTGTDGLVAMWTGSQVIVWNNDGDPGSYDPVANSWTLLPPMNFPTEQQFKTAELAVWTGHELLVWGQSNTSLGARYDPSTQTWKPTSTQFAPPGGNYTGLWTGEFLFVIGPSTATPTGQPSTIYGGLYCANAPNACSYTLDATGHAFGAGGGEGTIDITAGASACQWSATTDSSWITIQNSGAVGSGTLHYTVAPNTAANSRAGTITVSGQQFSVTQSGAPVISGVSVDGKNLIVAGSNFDPGSVVLINGSPAVSTLHDAQNPNTLIAKKGLKRIQKGDTGNVQVQNSDGIISAPFGFKRQ